jgi:hypothetical protein
VCLRDLLLKKNRTRKQCEALAKWFFRAFTELKNSGLAMAFTPK